MRDTATHYTTLADYHADRELCESNGWAVSIATFLGDGRIMLTLTRKFSALTH